MIERSDKIITWANLITFSGIISAITSIYFVWQGQKTDLNNLQWFIGAYIYTAVSDLIDGMVARRFGTSAWGEIMDPVRDKLIVIGTILLVNWQIFIIVAMIEMVGIYFSNKVRQMRSDHFVTKVSKWVTGFQFVATGILGALHIWSPQTISWWLLWILCLLSCVRLASYFHEYNRIKLSNGF